MVKKESLQIIIIALLLITPSTYIIIKNFKIEFVNKLFVDKNDDSTNVNISPPQKPKNERNSPISTPPQPEEPKEITKEPIPSSQQKQTEPVEKETMTVTFITTPPGADIYLVRNAEEITSNTPSLSHQTPTKITISKEIHKVQFRKKGYHNSPIQILVSGQNKIEVKLKKK